MFRAKCRFRLSVRFMVRARDRVMDMLSVRIR